MAWEDNFDNLMQGTQEAPPDPKSPEGQIWYEYLANRGKTPGWLNDPLYTGGGMGYDPYAETPEKLAARLAEKEPDKKPKGSIAEAVKWDVITDPDTGYLVNVSYDKDGNILSYEPLERGAIDDKGMSDYQKELTRIEREKWEWEKGQVEKGTLTEKEKADNEFKRQEFEWRKQQAEKESQWGEKQFNAQQAYQQQQLDWQMQQAQMQQAEQERQYKAQLAANPMSWLQYSAYTKEQPAVQPWMMPLSQKDYGWQTGQQIPGWNPEGGGGMADLTNPSTQYWARMGPTAQQQYAGYQQWDKAQRPEETQFRLGAQTAPAGRNFNLQWMK